MFYIIFGSFIIALGLECFLFPHNIITGGVSGIGKILNHYYQLDVSSIVFIINCLLFMIGYKVLQKDFAFKTLIASIVFPLSLKLLSLINIPVLVEDSFLSAMIAGCIIGYGTALTIKGGGSSGGIDIIGIIFEKKFKFPVSKSIMMIDVLLLSIQCFYHDTLQIIYGIITIFITSKVMDYALIQGQNLASIMIMTPLYHEICDNLLSSTINAGVTLLHSTTGYKKEERPVILTIVPHHKVPMIQNLVYGIDKEAFMIISNVEEVKGIIHS